MNTQPLIDPHTQTLINSIGIHQRMGNIFKDKNGNTVIAQKPNLPIIVWLVSLPLTWLPLNGLLDQFIDYVSLGSLFTWAWLELFRGANTFRRILGAIVFCAQFVGFIQ